MTLPGVLKETRLLVKSKLETVLSKFTKGVEKDPLPVILMLEKESEEEIPGPLREMLLMLNGEVSGLGLNPANVNLNLAWV